jgi:hypothetical protein
VYMQVTGEEDTVCRTSYFWSFCAADWYLGKHIKACHFKNFRTGIVIPLISSGGVGCQAGFVYFAPAWRPPPPFRPFSPCFGK